MLRFHSQNSSWVFSSILRDGHQPKKTENKLMKHSNHSQFVPSVLTLYEPTRWAPTIYEWGETTPVVGAPQPQ